MRTRHIFTLYVHWLYICICREIRDLYLHLLLFTKQATIYSSCLFKWQLLTSVIIYRSRWPVQDIRHCVMFGSDSSKLLSHSVVNRQADCGTAGHCSVLPSQVLFQ
jgi:hypothetical protein